MFEPITELVVNFRSDGAASFGEVCVRSSRFIDEDKGGLLIDAETIEELTFEASLFDKPAGINLVAILTVMNRIAFAFSKRGGGII